MKTYFDKAILENAYASAEEIEAVRANGVVCIGADTYEEDGVEVEVKTTVGFYKGAFYILEVGTKQVVRGV